MKKSFISVFALFLTTSAFAGGGTVESNNIETRTDVLKDIKVHAQSFVPAAYSTSESASEVRARGKKSVIARTNSICEERGGKITDYSLPYTEKVSDSVYGSRAVYHSYFAIIDEATCEVDVKREQELKTVRQQREEQYVKERAEAEAAEHARQLDVAKRNQKITEDWIKSASDAKSVCAFVLAQPQAAGYVESCFSAAASANISGKAAVIAMVATIKNVAFAPDFLTALSGRTLSQGVAEILLYITWENYAYGLEAVKASKDKIYTGEEEAYCLTKAKQNIYDGQTCLSEKGRNSEFVK